MTKFTQLRLAEAFRNALQASGQSPNRWAESLGMNPNTVRVWFASNRWPPDVLPLIAKMLGLDASATEMNPEAMRSKFEYEVAARVRPRRIGAEEQEKDRRANATELARNLLEHMPSDTEVIFDIPPAGPHSATNPEVLSYLFRGITQHGVQLTLYSNEPSGSESFQAKTRRSIVLFFLVAAILQQSDQQADSVAPAASALEVARRANALLDGKEAAPTDPFTLTRAEYNRIRRNLYLYVRADARAERFNPLTFILLKFGDPHPQFIAVGPDMDYLELDYSMARQFEDAIREQLAGTSPRLKPLHFEVNEVQQWAVPAGSARSILKIGD